MKQALLRRLRKIIYKDLESLGKLIDDNLRSYLDVKDVYQKKVYESMHYSLFTGGKRLRPIICIKSFELFDSDIEKILPVACSIEMIHTYSLIHDDLPSMDNDKYRRGNLTNHIVFGEALAILSGDGLLNLAYETMLKDALNNSKNIEDCMNRVKIMEVISNFAGVNGMIGGQVVDLLGKNENMDRDKLKFMYNAKTSALFQASALAGGILGGAEDYELEIMHNFSKNIGLAYQIKDDVLDIDEDKDKFTFLNLDGEAGASTKLELLTANALNELEKLKNRDTSFLQDLTNFLLNREI